MSEMEDLAAFAVLIEAGSFTAAAQRLSCSKGRLSKRISQLEKTYGVQLLHRTTRTLSLTSAGAALLPQARQLIAHMERARSIVALMRDEMVGEVRITTPVSLGETFFDGLLMEFYEAYPQVKIELELSNSFSDLRREGFDLAIRSQVASDERLVARPLLAMQELTCASARYLDEHGWPQTPEDLTQHRCLINSHYNSGRYQWLYHQHHELKRVQIDGPFASNHYSLLKKAALAGAGIARLPFYMVHEELDDARLHWLFREYQTATTPMFLVHPYESKVPRRVQVLADYLVGWFERSGSALERLA
ncbi:LysR family transcriptional regulator [Pseudomonas asturiensis]|uniref:LysR family transcriptional regulator n=1 Tax=Pseudomonas asturiensis TaxID=1190415 RepID=A0ABX6HGD6_9PSED|nr:LysR family transcriptional regulator [Pseudomonas asturiensis]QHF04607.1 LysR family transcriptional regulator [Pseudomonas asturiensis]